MKPNELVRVEEAPSYIAGNWDDDYGDYEPVENLGPYDDMDAAIQAIEAHETAVDILVAQRRTHFGGWPVKAVIRELNQADDDHDFGYRFIDGPEDDDRQSAGAAAG